MSEASVFYVTVWWEDGDVSEVAYATYNDALVGYEAAVHVGGHRRVALSERVPNRELMVTMNGSKIG